MMKSLCHALALRSVVAGGLAAPPPEPFLTEVGTRTWVIGNDVWNMTQGPKYGVKLWYGGRDCVRLSDLDPQMTGDHDEVILQRQALHAYLLRLKHPRTGKILEAKAPLPDEFRRTLEALRQHRPLG